VALWASAAESGQGVVHGGATTNSAASLAVFLKFFLCESIVQPCWISTKTTFAYDMIWMLLVEKNRSPGYLGVFPDLNGNKVRFFVSRNDTGL